MHFDDSDWSSTENNLSSWGDMDLSASSKKVGTGRWDVAQTLFSLLAATGASFLIAYLLKDQPERPAFLGAGIFLAPAVLVLLSALAEEWVTNHMTPTYSRNAQLVLTLVASLIIFLIGFLGNLAYNLGFAKNDNYIFVLDKSLSMQGTGVKSEEAIEKMLSQMNDGVNVGLVLFSDSVLGRTPVAKLDARQRERIKDGLYMERTGTTNFFLPLSAALAMLDSDPEIAKNQTRIIIITDGFEQGGNPLGRLSDNYNAISERCIESRATVYCVRLGGHIDDALQVVLDRTDGVGIEIEQADEFLSGLNEIGVEYHDLLRDASPAANVILFLLLLFTGSVLGATLWLMLSQKKQKRAQLILSPVMAVCAFAVIKFGSDLIQEQWLREAFGFSLLGLTVMRINRGGAGKRQKTAERSNDAGSGTDFAPADF